jgi:predicted lysophospholipase L1 biosynthesis ABC-type transport system permease subunit
VPIEGGAQVVSLKDGVLQVALDFAFSEDAAIEVADHPSSLPVYEGSDRASDPTRSTDFPVVPGLDGRFVPETTVGVGVLPQLLRSGSMVDLPFAIAAMGTVPNPLDYQVWLSPSASPAIRDALVKQGLDIVSVDTIAEREAELDRSGGALSLRLFLLAAVVALILGAGTLLANAYVVIRRRAYELAALRALGAPRTMLVRSARREQVTLALTGVALGAAAGLVAAGFALPPLLETAGGDGPPLWYGPAWTPVIALVLVVLALLVIVADVGARRTVRRALPDLLRQVQE